MTPARWLTDNAALVPTVGAALDVACGRGRNAAWLAARGLTTLAIDNDPDAVRSVIEIASELALPLQAAVVDLEAPVSLGVDRFDAIVVFRYLHRPLFPALRAALRPNGVLVYETFTRAQAKRGRPTNPAFLLEEGELRRLVYPLTVVAEREGEFEGQMLASIIARRDA
jgi:SAM-dependent methyltransferase